MVGVSTQREDGGGGGGGGGLGGGGGGGGGIATENCELYVIRMEAVVNYVLYTIV